MEDFNSKYSGEQVEALLDQVASGNAGGGGGGITVETDPIFSGSPAADITEEKMAEWDNKYAKPSGGIPQSDLAEEVKGALRKAEQYTGTVTEIKVNGNNIGASGGVVDLGNLGTYSKPTTGIPKSDLNSSVQASLEKADTAVQPADIKDDVYIADFTMYSLRTGMNSGTDVDCNIQALVTAMNANKVILVREDENIEGVHVLNGFAEDLLYFSIVDSSGNILWCDGVDYISSQGINARALRLQDWWKKQDALVSGENIKTINGESILGEGNIEISGGSGEVGPQGPQGDKGDKGDTGVGVQSVTQTTTSNADGGSNVVTVTLTDGTKSTFTVKNGSKGSQGIQGEQGPKGDTGATGATGAQGPKGDKGDTGPAGANGTNGTNGKDGVSVSSVKQTTTSTADGGTNVVTVTLSNGTTSTFSVKNGSKGSNGTNGTNGTNGKDGADGATFTPNVDANGNLSWTNNGGLANPPTVNIKGPKGDAGEGGGSTGGDGKDVIISSTSPYFTYDSPAQPNKVYVYTNALMTVYVEAFAEVSDYDTYTFIFRYPETGFLLPDEVKFPNGEIPNIEYDTLCELSIVGITMGSARVYNAVLAPFKPV